MRPHLKKILISCFRFSISILLVSLIIWKVGAENTLNRLISIDVVFFLGAASLVAFTFFLHTKRWLIILSSSGYSWRIRSAFREIWIGYFFNQLLPSSIGGDGVRALRLYQSKIPMGTAVRGILTERIFGLIACVLLSVVAIPIMLLYAPSSTATLVVEIMILLGLTGTLILLRPYQPLLNLFPQRLAREIHLLSATIKNETHFLDVMIISLAMQASIACAVALLSLGLGIQANPFLIGALFQPVTLMTVIPISLAGWGIREGALIAVLGSIGLASTDALPLSLALGTTLLLTSLPGGLCFQMGMSTPPKQISVTA